MVDDTVMVRDRVHPIMTVTVKLQNEQETERGNVHKQRMIDMGETGAQGETTGQLERPEEHAVNIKLGHWV